MVLFAEISTELNFLVLLLFSDLFFIWKHCVVKRVFTFCT